MKPFFKRLLAGGLAVLLACATAPLTAASEDTQSQVEEETESEPVSSSYTPRTEQDVLHDCMQIAAQNERLTFYVWDWEQTAQPAEDLFAVENRKTGFVWWSSPVNALGDEAATPILRKELASSVVMTYGKPADHSTATIRSADTSKCKISFAAIENGVLLTYRFTAPGITIPVRYELCEDSLRVSVAVSDIVEEHPTGAGSRLLTQLSLFGAFGAADEQAEGAFVLPDGCGALVRFHNGKTGAKTYSQPVYGSDLTAVPTMAPKKTEQIYLPMYGVVREHDALLTVIERGDANAQLQASVSGQSHSSYNLAGFTFTLRSMDTYYMGSQSEKLTVFESGGMKTPELCLRYYPLARDPDTEGYSDIAARYRRYLTEDGGVTPKTDTPRLYLDLYGGVQKPKNVLGIPVTMRQRLTSFSKAQEILTALDDLGAAPMAVSYHNWTSAGIDGKIDDAAAASHTLGGKDDLSALCAYANEADIPLYPVVSNNVFQTGKGYFSLWDSALRISGVSARILTYERAFGTPDEDADPRSLLTPAAFAELSRTLTDNACDQGLDGICPGGLTTLLYGDYGKKQLSRALAKEEITDSLSTLQGGVGSVLAQNANAYALPYVDRLTDLPLSSSGFDLFDEDIPLLQMVLHGIVPYATTAVNGSADAQTLMLQAAATGASLRYDLVGADISLLKDTEYDTLYYAHADNWLDEAARHSATLLEILAPVSSQTIRDCRVTKDAITTTYADGTVIRADFNEKTVTRGATVYRFSEEGGDQT